MKNTMEIKFKAIVENEAFARNVVASFILPLNPSINELEDIKTAVNRNDNISIEEMETLVNRLRNCNNPYTCPHGRPTIIFYSNYELEKLFKRAM